MKLGKATQLIATLGLGLAALAPVQATAQTFEEAFGKSTFDKVEFDAASFDLAFGKDRRAPTSFEQVYSSAFEQRIGMLANGDSGRIGVAAIDLSSGEQISILGDQRFPMASTSKIAIAATFLEGVENGRWTLEDKFPLLIPIRSKKYSSLAAPVREGTPMPAIELIEIMITRSNNPATDALLKAVGGPQAVNDWVRRAGIEEFNIERDIATLVRDDGEFDPAVTIDSRDSATPLAMVTLLKGIYDGQWLSAASREVILGAMERTVTGKRRIPALMPDDAIVAHKTGSLRNTSSDIGFMTAPDGRSFAVAIYVTGQGAKRRRETRIATIARAIYDGYTEPGPVWVNASYGAGGSD